MENLNKWLKQKLRRRYREWQIRRNYTQPIPNPGLSGPTPVVIHVLDNKRRHGGLLDRIKGIVSSYLIAQQLGYGFKVYVNADTFNLFKYLIPYDDNIVCQPDQWIQNSTITKPLYLYNYRPDTKDILLSEFKGGYAQFHVYGNLDYTSLLLPANQLDSGAYWGKTFRQLFRFSDGLKQKANEISASIESKSIGVHARFMGLLGDFEDVSGTALLQQDKEDLLRRCIQKVNSIANAEKERQINIVSDSSTFLDACLQAGIQNEFADRLHIDTSDIGHIDIKHDEEILQKTILDFYLLCRCNRIYQLLLGDMYHSQFSRYAAYLAEAELLMIKEN